MIYDLEHRKWIVKKNCYHILYIMFENIAQYTYISIEKIVEFCTCENTM
jgi:hypothetical protein